MRASSTTDPPNFRLEPTPYSLSSAAASGRGSCGALVTFRCELDRAGPVFLRAARSSSRRNVQLFVVERSHVVRW